MPQTLYCYFDSPLGRLVARSDGEFVTGLYLPAHKGWHGPEPSWRQAESPFAELRDQLAEYFAGARREFDLAYRCVGTPFQERVWQELARIPFGATITYAELARRVGNPHASRAVGAANARNPVSVVVPCHRVIGADGGLSGYAGGVDKKRWLLERERRFIDIDRRRSPDAPSGSLTAARETRSA